MQRTWASTHFGGQGRGADCVETGSILRKTTDLIREYAWISSPNPLRLALKVTLQIKMIRQTPHRIHFQLRCVKFLPTTQFRLDLHP